MKEQVVNVWGLVAGTASVSGTDSSFHFSGKVKCGWVTVKLYSNIWLVGCGLQTYVVNELWGAEMAQWVRLLVAHASMRTEFKPPEPKQKARPILPVLWEGGDQRITGTYLYLNGIKLRVIEH